MLSQLLEKIARSLEEQGIDYMIIGGQAVLVHGQPRLTQAIDIALGIGPDRPGGYACPHGRIRMDNTGRRICQTI